MSYSVVYKNVMIFIGLAKMLHLSSLYNKYTMLYIQYVFVFNTTCYIYL